MMTVDQQAAGWENVFRKDSSTPVVKVSGHLTTPHTV